MTKTPVDKSNYDPKKCQATCKRSGKQCGQWKMNGTNVCRMHGAANKQSKTKHKRTKDTARIERTARRLGTPVDGQDPSQVLLDQVASKAAEVEWLKRQVELIENDDDLFWSTQRELTRELPAGDTTETTKEATQHIIYSVLHKAQDQLVRYAGETLRAGVEERQVKAAERTGEQFEQVLMTVLSSINATPEQLQLASTEVPRVLRNMSA